MAARKPGQTTQEGEQFPFSKPPGRSKIRRMARNQTLAALDARESPPRLGERLLAERLINEGQLLRALELQPISSRPLGRVLIDLGVIDEDRLTVVLGEHLGVPVADLRKESVDFEV